MFIKSHGKPLQTLLMFVRNMENTFQMLHFRVGSLTSPQSLDYDGKGLSMTSTIAYYEHSLIMSVKFI